MKKLMKYVWQVIFLALLALGLYSYVIAQDKPTKPAAPAEDKLKLTEQENAALDGILKDSQEKRARFEQLQQGILDASNGDDKTLLLVERFRKASEDLRALDTQATNWFQAVRNRAGCPDCNLNQQERRLVKPETPKK